MLRKNKRPRTLTRKVIDNVIISTLILGGMWLFYQFKINSNFHVVVPETVYRSGQPRKEQLREWIETYQIKTVLNLRGANAPGVADEQAITDEKGVKLCFMEISAYLEIEPEKLMELIELFETCETPILLHCRDGIDRTGTAGTIAAMYFGHQPYAKAKGHSYVPPGPWKRKARKNNIHISDTFISYENYCREHHLNPDVFDHLKQWAQARLDASKAESITTNIH